MGKAARNDRRILRELCEAGDMISAKIFADDSGLARLFQKYVRKYAPESDERNRWLATEEKKRKRRHGGTLHGVKPCT